jgi:hypothetical protein
LILNKNTLLIAGSAVVLDGVLVSVLAMVLNVRSFKPGQGREIFKDNKNVQLTFLLRRVKSVVPCL